MSYVYLGAPAAFAQRTPMPGGYGLLLKGLGDSGSSTTLFHTLLSYITSISIRGYLEHWVAVWYCLRRLRFDVILFVF